MQITKQQAGLLYGNSYLLQHLESGRIITILGVTGNKFSIKFKGAKKAFNLIGFEDIGITYKILARRNDFSKLITHKGESFTPENKVCNYQDQELSNTQYKYMPLVWTSRLEEWNFRGNLPEELVTYNDDVYNS